MSDARAQRYALAGAMAVTVGELLHRVHSAAGGPVAGNPEALPAHKRTLAVAAARARGAAGACSGVVTRLLLIERDAAREQLQMPDVVERPEFGVTMLEGLEHQTWAVTVRAVAAAGAEILNARDAWEQWDGPPAQDVRASLTVLLRYADQLAVLLESTEPADGETAQDPEPTAAAVVEPAPVEASAEPSPAEDEVFVPDVPVDVDPTPIADVPFGADVDVADASDDDDDLWELPHATEQSKPRDPAVAFNPPWRIPDPNEVDG